MVRLRRAWAVWAAVSVGMAGYAGMALIAAYTVTTKLQLTPANKAEVTLFRLIDDTLRFDLTFRAKGCEQRPELGSWVNSEIDGLLTLRPEAEVRMVASVPSAPPLEYEAMPKSAYCSDGNLRRMTANLSVKPGVYRWPPPSSTPSIKLHAGFNTVRFEVTKVGEPLVGETVELDVQPPLGFKSSPASLRWLWFALLLWPVFIIVQVIWAACLLVMSWRQQRRALAAP